MEHRHDERSPLMQTGIENCTNCHAVCLDTIGHALKKGGEHAKPELIKLMQDCTQFCMTSVDFMLRTSNFHPQVCGICADICAACAKECERLAVGADFMQRCADACRKSEDTCRQMSLMASTAAA